MSGLSLDLRDGGVAEMHDEAVPEGYPDRDNVTPRGTEACSVELDRDGVTVRVVGELDLLLSRELTAVLQDLTVQGRLLIDLDGVEFMDSTGLATLIGAQKKADRDGYVLQVRYNTPQVIRLLELSGMVHYFRRD